ncbi:MAG TPA: TIGR01777 family oxidoreductase [Mycobacterium sp.]
MFETTDIVQASRDDVWSWFTRPGALQRLAPPWQPVRVQTEATSLRDGQAVLALPAGLRWIATHQPAGYQEGHRFVDRLTSWPLAPVLNWRHEHHFTEAGPDRTKITDRVDTRLPDAFLRPMFAYRQRQLADDLAAHAWAREAHPDRLTVAVTGSSGLVGTALSAMLSTGGHRVIRLVRRNTAADDERAWNPVAPDPALLGDVDVLVHLAGATIAGRFDAGHKAAIRDSRIGPTRRLAELAAGSAARARPVVMVCASAVGIYGPNRGDEILTEASDRGEGFLADVVADWEDATRPAAEAGLRVVNIRTGIVQTPASGSLKLLRPLFEAGLGGRLGDGDQWTPWIGLDDLLDIYLRAIVDTRIAGPINAAAPDPVTNADYTRTLGTVLRRPTILPTPSFGIRLLLGAEGATEVALAGQRAIPARLNAIGHRFRFPALEPALRHMLGHAT